jgi:tRNA (guanine37-N1)-methyltransferase
MSAQGVPFTQAMASEFSKLPGMTLVAGRYEGLDERVIESRIDREVSVGDYVLSGGEFPALVIIDAVARLIPGVLGDERSAVEESFDDGLLDWPHYTRPVEFEGRTVPEVLQGGHHADIQRWRLKQAVARTWLRRPDLIARGELPADAAKLLDEFLAEREGDRHG